MKKIKKIILAVFILAIIYWIPFLAISLIGRLSIIDSIDRLPEADAIIVFGALITKDKEITPILKERLDAGQAIFNYGIAKKIVVSNTSMAAKIMAEYYYGKNISPEAVEIDSQAEKTVDTCVYEKNNHPEGRKAIFVSSGFHLPRLLFQCKKAGVDGVAFPAEKLETIDRSQYSLFTIISTRASRYIREAALSWQSLFM